MDTPTQTLKDFFNAHGINATSGREVNLCNAMKKTGLPMDAFDLETCSDEKTGFRYGMAKCRAGYAYKLGHTTYSYQVWAVVKPEFRTRPNSVNHK